MDSCRDAMYTKRVRRTNIIVMMLVYVTRGPGHLQFLQSTITKSVFILANSADPDETPRFAASHLRLRCLYMFLIRMHSACSTTAYYEF